MTMFNYEALSLVMEGKIISETAYFISLLLFKTSECGINLDRKPFPLLTFHTHCTSQGLSLKSFFFKHFSVSAISWLKAHRLELSDYWHYTICTLILHVMFGKCICMCVHVCFRCVWYVCFEGIAFYNSHMHIQKTKLMQYIIMAQNLSTGLTTADWSSTSRKLRWSMLVMIKVVESDWCIEACYKWFALRPMLLYNG